MASTKVTTKMNSRSKSGAKPAKRSKSSAGKKKTTSKTTSRKTTSTTVKKSRSQSKRSSSKKPASSSRGDSAASGASSRGDKKSRASRGASKASSRAKASSRGASTRTGASRSTSRSQRKGDTVEANPVDKTGEGNMETVAAGTATSSQTKLEVRPKKLTNRYSAPVDIINMSGKTVAYKIKTNVGNLLSVNPSCMGLLKAGQSIPIEIYVNGEFKTEIKYTVLLLSVYVPSTHDGKPASAVWNDSRLLSLDTTCTALNLTFNEKTAKSEPSEAVEETGPDGKPKEPMVTMVLFEERSFVRPMSDVTTIRPQAQTEAATKQLTTPARSGIPMMIIMVALIGIAFALYFRMRARSGTPAPSYYRK